MNDCMSANDKCPKCHSDMIKHPSLFSMPLSSLPKTNADNDSQNTKTPIEDQEAKFIFEFNSCRQCGYSEFYLKT
jgi:predicted nucleic-acid-binding Zn-ribbon protein